MKNRILLNKILALFSLLIIIGTWSYSDYKRDSKIFIENQQTKAELQKELLLNSSCNHYVDSLVNINGELSKFKALTMAMIHRGEATRDLKYQVGDIVYLKQDSSRVVVEDLIIGGGNYNYFIKYRVLFKNDSRKEVTPEMIF
jgi:hypothetical protein